MMLHLFNGCVILMILVVSWRSFLSKKHYEQSVGLCVFGLADLLYPGVS